MYNVKLYNKISKVGLDDLDPAKYTCSEDFEDYDAVLVRSAKLHDVQFPKSLKCIARAGAGVNNIPLDRCAEEGIVVFNTPGANANAVKEIVVCGLMLGSRDIAGGIAWCRHNAADENIAKAAEKAKKAFAGREVKGKKLGVIGLGAIGAEVANIAIDLGMDVYGYDPYVSVGAAWRISSAVHHVTNLDDIFRTCDYMTIHVPAMEGTIGMIDERACSLMKDGAVFLNFSRDTLVDVPAMASALASGKVGCYVTDFATPEVMAMENAIVLPHLGASTEEAEDNCARMAVVELMDYIDNGNIMNSVNYPACQAGVCPEGMFRIAVLYNSSDLAMGSVTEILEPIIAEFDMVDNQRDEHGYALITLTENLADEVLERIAELDGAYLVRRVK